MFRLGAGAMVMAAILASGGWQEFVPRRPSPPPSTKPQLAILHERIEKTPKTGEKSMVADFALHNSHDVPLKFLGGDTEGKTIVPLYRVQVKRADGKGWQELNDYFCEVGYRPKSLAPGETCRFQAKLRPPVDFARIGVECTWEVDGKPVKTLIWSPIFSPP